jgi:hypothetical protein
MVIPILDSAPFTYAVSGDENTVKFIVRLSRFTSHWQVVDHLKPQVLTIEALHPISFTAEPTDVLERVNERNADCIGKFRLVNGQHL